MNNSEFYHSRKEKTNNGFIRVIAKGTFTSPDPVLDATQKIEEILKTIDNTPYEDIKKEVAYAYEKCKLYYLSLILHSNEEEKENDLMKEFIKNKKEG